MSDDKQIVGKEDPEVTDTARQSGNTLWIIGGAVVIVALVVVVAFLLLNQNHANNSTGNGTGDESLAAPTVLQQAISATAATNSFHFKIIVNGQTAAGSAFYIKGGEGDYAKPNQVSAKIDAVYAGATVEASYAGKGDKQYIAVIGCWQPFNELTLAPDKAATDIMNNIKSLNKVGVEDMDGARNHHLTGQINAQQLAALSPEAVQTNTVNVDMWVGVADGQLHRVLLSGAISRGDAKDATYDIHFSDYDKPVTVTLPPDNQLCKGK